MWTAASPPASASSTAVLASPRAGLKPWPYSSIPIAASSVQSSAIPIGISVAVAKASAVLNRQ